MRDSMIFYKSFAEAIRCLDKDDQLTAFWNIIDYALDEIEPEGSGVSMAVFKMAKPQIDTNAKRYKNGSKGGRPKPNDNQTITKPEPNHNQTITKQEPNHNQSITKPKPNHNQTITKAEPNVNVNDNDNVNDNVNDNDNVNVNVNENQKESNLKVTKERFKPPTIDEVGKYCAERGNAVDAERFVDFYESKGWMVGKNKMKDWKSAVRNWERSEKATKPSYMSAIENRVKVVDDW